MLHKLKLTTLAIGTVSLMSLATPVFAHECDHCNHMISKMDTNGDGQISRTEFMKHHGQKFDEHDHNNDRFLDAEELHHMMEQMHGEGHGHGHGHDDDSDHGHHGDDNGHGHDH